MTDITKICIRCNKSKSIDDFHVDGRRKDGRYPYCKQCRGEYYSTPKWREVARKQTHAARQESPELREKHVRQERERRYKRFYDISIEDYDTMLEFQEGKCAICFRPPKTKRLAVDHDHKTGEIRGLLCNNCNQTLHGRISMDWLYNAHAYLDVPPVHQALGRTPQGIIGSTKKRKRRKKPASLKKLHGEDLDPGERLRRSENVVKYLKDFEKRRPPF